MPRRSGRRRRDVVHARVAPTTSKSRSRTRDLSSSSSSSRAPIALALVVVVVGVVVALVVRPDDALLPRASAFVSSSSASLSSSSIVDRRGRHRRRRPSTRRADRVVVVIAPSSRANDDDDNDDPYDYDAIDRPAENVPRTGYSLADRMENVDNVERFVTTLTPLSDHRMMMNVSGGTTRVDFKYDEDGFPIGYREVTDVDNDDHDDEDAGHRGVARIDTFSTLGDVGGEPTRWLISMGNDDDGGGAESYAMIDLPPYSDGLADEIRNFMDRRAAREDDVDVDAAPRAGHDVDDVDGGGGTTRTKKKKTTTTGRRGNLDVILITSRQCIHYDASPGVYVTRRSDLTRWKDAFPSANVVMYRLDVPRECRDGVTQALDGYGPWGYDEGDGERHDDDIDDIEGDRSAGRRRGMFVETGRPLTIEEWDDDTKSRVLTRGEFPPDDDEATVAGVGGDVDDDNDDGDGDSSRYSPEAIRRREEAYRLLAVYTPGHTFGSVTYVFPERGICCSGYALPLDSSDDGGGYDNDNDDNDDDGSAPSFGGAAGSASPPPRGPRLDYRGYLATSASRPRQMSSALSLIDDYIDRFRVILPARGDAVFLDSATETRRRELMESVGLYKKISDIYARLGIVE